jgi:hypothetical protein
MYPDYVIRASEYTFLHYGSTAFVLPRIKRGEPVTKEALCRADPDGRISRIRLSDKDSRVRPREVACPGLKPH